MLHRTNKTRNQKFLAYPKKNLFLNKKGVSVMIGYVLLVSLAVVMGGVMYKWMSSYIPTENLECPDGVSLIVTNYSYDCTNETLNLTIRNNGRFDIAGYHIKATDNESQSLAVRDLSIHVIKTQEEMFKYSQAVVLGSITKNNFSTGDSTENSFDVSFLMRDGAEVESVELIPVRWQRDDNNKLRFVGCGEITKYTEKIDCS